MRVRRVEGTQALQAFLSKPYVTLGGVDRSTRAFAKLELLQGSLLLLLLQEAYQLSSNMQLTISRAAI